MGHLKSVHNLILCYGLGGRVGDTRRLVDGIIDFRHKVVADALVNAILFEDNLERVER